MTKDYIIKIALLSALLYGAGEASAVQAREASFLPPTPEQTEAAAAEDTIVTPAPEIITAPEKIERPEPAVDLGKPVTTQPLGTIDPDTAGLLSETNGGLGSTMWQKTSRALVDVLLPSLNLPVASPVLNKLARRMLLSVAAVPEGAQTSEKSLVALRIDQLIALGNAHEAWQLMIANTQSVDEETMRSLVDVALIDPDNKKICAQIPKLMTSYGKKGSQAISWQKALMLCHAREGNKDALHLGLDMMREEKVKDDIFLTLISQHILEDRKYLPRQLTPLRPLNLALLRQINKPLPSALYANPDAALVRELLRASTLQRDKRLELAEKMAARGILSFDELALFYEEEVLPEDVLTQGLSKSARGAKKRAHLYKMIKRDDDVQKRIELIKTLWVEAQQNLLTDVISQMLAPSVEEIKVISDYNAFAATAAHILAMAGRPEKSLPWVVLLNGPAKNLPDVKAEYAISWPLFVLSGLVSDADYAEGMNAWLDDFLIIEDKGTESIQEQKQAKKRYQAGSVLALFSAAGFSVSDKAWAKVLKRTDVNNKKQPTPSPALMERLRGAALGGRRGEVVLESLLLAEEGMDETNPHVIVEIVRALRQVGLSGDAQNLAREAVSAWLVL